MTEAERDERAELLDLFERQEPDDERPVTVSFTVSRAVDKRLDRYLVDRVPFLSRTSLQRLIREESVTVNGRIPKPSTRLRGGDSVVAVLPPPPSNEIGADDIPLDILYEDDDLILVNKQSNLIVHPARSIKRGTLINALAWHFLHSGRGTLSSVGEEFARPGVVHRLDRHTTGAMVAAKNDTAHWRLAKEFEARRVSKRYLALVHGTVEPDADMIDLPIGKHPSIRERYAVRWDDTAKACRTICRVVERYPAPPRAEPRGAGAANPANPAEDACTLVELDLLTGRTHQIRVHLTHLGWPIVGDDLYGGRALLDPRDALPPGASGPAPAIIARQALHAATLGFRHPMSGAECFFTAPVAADFRRAVEFLRARGSIAVDAAGTSVDLASVGLARAG